MKRMRLECNECKSEVYLEALATYSGEVVVEYESAICSNKSCENGNSFFKYWDEIAEAVADE